MSSTAIQPFLSEIPSSGNHQIHQSDTAFRVSRVTAYSALDKTTPAGDRRFIRYQIQKNTQNSEFRKDSNVYK